MTEGTGLVRLRPFVILVVMVGHGVLLMADTVPRILLIGLGALSFWGLRWPGGGTGGMGRPGLVRVIGLVAITSLVAGIGGTSFLERLAVVSLFVGTALAHGRETCNRHAWSLLVALLELVATAGLTSHVLFGLAIVVHLFAGTLALTAFTLYGPRTGLAGRIGHSDGSKTPVVTVDGPPVLSGAVVRLAVRGTTVMVLCTVVLFFVIPRWGAGFFFSSDSSLQRRSGFTDDVDLGAISAITLSDRVALRVELPDHAGPYPETLHLRGVALDQFDGHRWRVTPGKDLSLQDVRRGMREQKYFINPPVTRASRELRQRVHSTPENATHVFGATRALRVWGKFTRFTRTVEESLPVEFPAFGNLFYEVVSDMSRPTAAQLAASGTFTNPVVRARYLTLPTGLDPRVTALARQLSMGTRSSFDVVHSVQRHLLTRYKYQLPTGDPEATTDRPLERFLFETKAGHCGLFATAMVVLLRASGVPARLVNGFAEGTYNSVGGYYVFSDRDAHSWVEVLYPNYGWIDFDPTPPRASANQRSTWARQLWMRWDALVMAWRRDIVGYHLVDQIEILRALGDLFRAKPRPGTSGARPMKIPGVVSVVVVAFLAIVALLMLIARQARPAPRRGLGAAEFIETMLGHLKRLGFAREPWRTVAQFASDVELRRPDLGPAVNGLAAAYARVRLAEGSLDSGETAQVGRWLSEIEGAPRSAGRK